MVFIYGFSVKVLLEHSVRRVQITHVLSSVSRPTLGPTQPLVQLVPGGPFPGVKALPGRDADHSPPSSAEGRYE
jgi:hypothetical protein